jgi:hypothetical protein
MMNPKAGQRLKDDLDALEQSSEERQKRFAHRREIPVMYVEAHAFHYQIRNHKEQLLISLQQKME